MVVTGFLHSAPKWALTNEEDTCLPVNIEYHGGNSICPKLYDNMKDHITSLERPLTSPQNKKGALANCFEETNYSTCLCPVESWKKRKSFLSRYHGVLKTVPSSVFLPRLSCQLPWSLGQVKVCSHGRLYPDIRGWGSMRGKLLKMKSLLVIMHGKKWGNNPGAIIMYVL